PDEAGVGVAPLLQAATRSDRTAIAAPLLERRVSMCSPPRHRHAVAGMLLGRAAPRSPGIPNPGARSCGWAGSRAESRRTHRPYGRRTSRTPVANAFQGIRV